MKYSIVNGRIKDFNSGSGNNQTIEIVSYKKGKVPVNENPQKLSILNSIFSQKANRYEYFGKFDVLCLNEIHIEKSFNILTPIYVILEENKITFYTFDSNKITELLTKIMADPVIRVDTCDVLYYLVHSFIEGDLQHLEDIEDKLAKLEASIFSDSAGKKFSKKILSLKKHLMQIELYYEQFINLLADFMQNQNDLLSSSSIAKFSMIDSKIDKLISKTRNLLSYASEIRSTYLAEMDLQLNRSMKILTIISVIVLPLSLIVGWYGMNFKMPEYASSYSYPILIVVCVLIIILLIRFFKKNKWF